MKQVMAFIFGILISVGHLCSCQKPTQPELNTYSVSVKNNYFEDLDSLTIANYKITKLAVNSVSEEMPLPAGTHRFSVYTQSKLNILGDIIIKGKKPTLTLIIRNNGEVVLD